MNVFAAISESLEVGAPVAIVLGLVKVIELLVGKLAPTKKADTIGNLEHKVDRIVQTTNDLHRWHDIDDPDHPGAKVWYSQNRPVVAELRELGKETKRVVQVIERHNAKIDRHNETLQRLLEKLS